MQGGFTLREHGGGINRGGAWRVHKNNKQIMVLVYFRPACQIYLPDDEIT
jgi:hypothetical protein